MHAFLTERIIRCSYEMTVFVHGSRDKPLKYQNHCFKTVGRERFSYANLLVQGQHMLTSYYSLQYYDPAQFYESFLRPDSFKQVVTKSMYNDVFENLTSIDQEFISSLIPLFLFSIYSAHCPKNLLKRFLHVLFYKRTKAHTCS